MWSWLAEAQPDSGEAQEVISATDFLALRVMWLVATHPESPGAMLDVIAEQCSEALVERVAENPSTWPSTLRKVAQHPSTKVRTAVVQNTNTPASVLFDLACDESTDIRYAVAECYHSDSQLLDHLSEDDNSYVAARAKKTLAKLFPTPAAQMPFRKMGAAAEPVAKRKVAER
jgi:hypothetical protein